MIEFSSYQFDYLFPRFIFKHDFLINNDLFFPSYRVFEDPVFLTNAMICAGSFYALPQPTYKYSGAHQSSQLDLRKLKDCVRGITDVLNLTSANSLNVLHKTNIERLAQQVSYYVETLMTNTDDELWYLLLKANSSINTDLISNDPCNYYLIPAIKTIIESGKRYHRIRNAPIIRQFIRLIGKF